VHNESVFALGRKNWLFAGSDKGGERAPAILSLIETAKLNGLDPEAYLELNFSRRVRIEVPDGMMGIGPICWQTIFSLEAINTANADKGELVWDE